MNPYLDSQNNPRIRVDISLTSWLTCGCRIDTGSSGGIALPDRYLVAFPIYRVTVRFRSETKEVTMFFTKGSDGLVGIEFLRGFRFVLDLKRQSVTLEV